MNTRVERVPSFEADAPCPRDRLTALARASKRAFVGAVVCVIALVIALAFVGQCSRSELKIPPGHLGQYISVAGDQIRYSQTGHGPDLLLIHGQPGQIEDWQPMIHAAEGRYRVTAYDRPGHGFSGEPGDYSLRHNADVALELIRKLQLTNVIVLGHSYGGAVVLEMAVRNPSHVKAFVALATVTTPGGRPKQPTVLRVFRWPLVGRGSAVVLGKMIGPSFVRAGLEGSFHPDEALLTKEVLEERFKVYLQPKVLVTLSREKSAFDGDLGLIAPKFSRIRKPLHFVHGRLDQRVPWTTVETFHEKYSWTRLTMVAHAGHSIQFAHPEVVMGIVDSLSR